MAREKLTPHIIRERLRGVIVQQIGCDPEEVRAAAHLVDDLGMDSLDYAEITMAIEEEFRWPEEEEIPLEEMQNWKTVGDMVRTVANRFGVKLHSKEDDD